MKTKKCAFTGHRPQSLPFGFNEADERCIALKQKLRDEIIRQIEENGVTHFITGMAIGIWWTRQITLLRYGTGNRVAQGKPYSMRNSRVSRCVSSIP